MPETELKFALDAAAFAHLRARLDQLGAPERRILHSVYFDTRKLRLKKAGVALRMRRDGERWIQTVKAKARNHGGLQRAEEAEADMPDALIDLTAIPDETLRVTVQAALKGRMLQPVCETRMERLLLVVHGAEGAAVEVALDEGLIAAGDRAETFRELELELKSGPLSALYELAADLLPETGAVPSMLSKSERGYLLAAEGRIHPPAVPHPAAEVAVARSQTAGEARARQAEFSDGMGRGRPRLSRTQDCRRKGADQRSAPRRDAEAGGRFASALGHRIRDRPQRGAERHRSPSAGALPAEGDRWRRDLRRALRLRPRHPQGPRPPPAIWAWLNAAIVVSMTADRPPDRDCAAA